ncbi:hypothetical protein GCM10010129_27620 [Streptomyces fumigatiscleroticus]|nr:hypothetical protein GCM10010129_27620 [Streptomyces fumigatiscleroticus]
MKHRGRHRRRRQGRALRAVLAGAALALTAAATMISASQATVAEDPGALRPLTATADTGRLRLTEHRVPRPWLDRLASDMGRPVGVGAVLDTPDGSLRDAADCPAEDRSALPVAPAATRAWCWDADDTRGLRAGAVTTSGDADADGRWGGHRVVLAGWSEDGGSAARDLARVSFVDADAADRPGYTSALLAVPVDGGHDYRGLASPVSGMVWYQDKLLVTAGEKDRNALYVYDLNRVQRATVDAAAVGRVRGGFSAHGHRFVLPAVATYTLPAACAPDTDDGVPCLGGISLDRTTAPDSLAVSEAAGPGGERHTRLWRYSFSQDPGRTGLLAADALGRVAADEAFTTRAGGVEGVLSHRAAGAARADWYLSRAAATHDGHGILVRQNTDGAATTECGTDSTRRCWSAHTRSLSYWEETGEVWSQSGRMLFALPLSSVDRALG